MAYKKRKVKKAMTPAQERNAKVFRLRGFWANAQTLPFSPGQLKLILRVVDEALEELDATTQTIHEGGR